MFSWPSKSYNLLISENISKFDKWRAKTTSKTQQSKLIYIKVKIYLNFWTKFPLNNRQPSNPIETLFKGRCKSNPGLVIK